VNAFRAGLLLILLGLTLFPVSCSRVSAAVSAPKTFASPEEAGEAFHQAARSGDQAALLAIFGQDGKELLFSGDPATDQNALQDFAATYEAMNRWGDIAAGGKVLYIGTENFPFPIPLEKDSAGRWYFDTASGADEILARRIGRNELMAIAALGALTDAEQQYFSQVRSGRSVQQYAGKFASDPGTQNGLFWPATEGQPASPLAQMGDFATVSGFATPGAEARPFGGYYFRLLTEQGKTAKGGAKDYVKNGAMTEGFAILAYPAGYRDTGIMSFIVGEDGVVYEKDLGERTAEAAASITDYNPGDGWKPVSD
jgi:hypothetical protein